MKKLIFSIACLASVGVFIFNSKIPQNASDLTMENIEVVGLSAGETECDASNINECSIYSGGLLVIKATGKGIVYQ